MTKIVYVGVPSSIKREVAAIIAKYRAALPGWLERLTFEFLISPEYGSEGAIAQIEVRYEYRHASIRIHGKEWERPDVDKERVIVHELMHCHVSPIEKLAHSLLDRRAEAGENEAADPLLEAMYEQVRIAMESTVEDVALAVIASRHAP